MAEANPPCSAQDRCMTSAFPPQDNAWLVRLSEQPSSTTYRHITIRLPPTDRALLLDGPAPNIDSMPSPGPLHPLPSQIISGEEWDVPATPAGRRDPRKPRRGRLQGLHSATQLSPPPETEDCQT